MQLVTEFNLLRYAIGIFSGIVVSMATAIVFIYKDSKSERLAWREEVKQMNDDLRGVIDKNTEAWHENCLSSRELREAIKSQEKAVERLERVIDKAMANGV